MKRLLLLGFLAFAAAPASAAPVSSPCTQSGPGASRCDPVNQSNPLPIAPNSYPSGAAAITGNATGTTGAVVGTLAAASSKTTYICGFHIDSTGTGAIGPITVAGLVGSSMVFQANAGAANGVNQVFTPCIPASAVNTAITITTTADASATAVDVNSWGYQQ